jgi:hypothetical protein
VSSTEGIAGQLVQNNFEGERKMLMWKVIWGNSDHDGESDDIAFIKDEELLSFINEITLDESVTDVRVTKESKNG